MKVNKGIAGAALILPVVAVVAIVLMTRTSPAPKAGEGPMPKDAGGAASVAQTTSVVRNGKALPVASSERQDGGKGSPAAKRPPKPALSVLDGEDAELTPQEKALAERIEKALDDENFEAAAKCAEEALKCPSAEVRQSMVDTLGWFGSQALPELTPFLADADEDVRDSAMDEWSSALSDIESDKDRIATVELAMSVLEDEDSLETISDEYIGVDEKLAVESLLRIIEGGGSKGGIAKAKETYEFVTGDEFVSRAAAEKWIAEEYEPPEPEPETPQSGD